MTTGQASFFIAIPWPEWIENFWWHQTETFCYIKSLAKVPTKILAVLKKILYELNIPIY